MDALGIDIERQGQLFEESLTKADATAAILRGLVSIDEELAAISTLALPSILTPSLYWQDISVLACDVYSEITYIEFVARFCFRYAASLRGTLHGVIICGNLICVRLICVNIETEALGS